MAVETTLNYDCDWTLAEIPLSHGILQQRILQQHVSKVDFTVLGKLVLLTLAAVILKRQDDRVV
jgi:hypothetical protein